MADLTTAQTDALKGVGITDVAAISAEGDETKRKALIQEMLDKQEQNNTTAALEALNKEFGAKFTNVPAIYKPVETFSLSPSDGKLTDEQKNDIVAQELQASMNRIGIMHFPLIIGLVTDHSCGGRFKLDTMAIKEHKDPTTGKSFNPKQSAVSVDYSPNRTGSKSAVTITQSGEIHFAKKDNKEALLTSGPAEMQRFAAGMIKMHVKHQEKRAAVEYMTRDKNEEMTLKQAMKAVKTGEIPQKESHLTSVGRKIYQGLGGGELSTEEKTDSVFLKAGRKLSTGLGMDKAVSVKDEFASVTKFSPKSFDLSKIENGAMRRAIKRECKANGVPYNYGTPEQVKMKEKDKKAWDRLDRFINSNPLFRLIGAIVSVPLTMILTAITLGQIYKGPSTRLGITQFAYDSKIKNERGVSSNVKAGMRKG